MKTKKKGENVIPMRLFIMNQISICGRFETFAFAFNGNWSEIKKKVSIWGLKIRWSNAQTSFLCRARQETRWDQTTTGKDTKWKQCFQSFSLSMAQTICRRILCPTMLNNDWKTYRNHGRFDVECVEFTTTLLSHDLERYCTVKQHHSSICT